MRDNTNAVVRVLSVATAVPSYQVSQEGAKGFAREMFGGAFRDVERLLPIFDHSEIENRHLCVPFEWAREDHTFPQKNSLYVEHALDLTEKAARRAMDRAGVEPEDVGSVFFVSTTGISTPSIDSQLLPKLGLSEHTRRVPIWGLGCAGGAGGLARAAEHAQVYPEKVVLLIGVELCSFTYQRWDLSVANLISTALFADGAAAVVLGVSSDDGPEILGSHSTTWPGTQDIMGWNLVETGLQVQLSRSIPDLVRNRVPETLRQALSSLDLEFEDIKHFVTHPGGARVLEAFEEVFGLEPGGLALSREVLRYYGNMSSATVLFILERLMESGDAAPGDHGVLSAMGPGFSAEHVFLRF